MDRTFYAALYWSSMSAAMEGRIRKHGLKSAIGWMALALFLALGLSLYKGQLLDELSRQKSAELRTKHPAISNLFQASFYFFYEDQFLPGIRETLERTENLKRIQVLSNAGGELFDSAAVDFSKGGQSPPEPKPFAQTDISDRLSLTEPSLFVRGFEARILMPSGQYGILYTFDGAWVRNRILGYFFLGLALIGLMAWLISRPGAWRILEHGAVLGVRAWGKSWGLRSRFLAAIVLVNVITGAIVFFTLSAMQTREQTQRIQKESVLFSQFSTAQVITDFSNHFYFYYADKFLPGIRTIVAANENLVGIRIISSRTQALLFDSEQAALTPTPMPASDAPKETFPAEVQAELTTRDLVSRLRERDGERLLSVIHTYRSESGEPLFWVEYLFSFQSLTRSVSAIRRQILIDLVPSMGLGLLIAILFAQWLISPIRKLVGALGRVTSGDYNVSVNLRRRDEIGDLVGAFNAMTTELRKKKELRKYLSDSTYRQIMQAPESADGVRIGGSRVQATILYSDIRNFVAHCESLEAEEVTSMLNEYFSEMVEVVHKHGGEVDKFIGDALLAVFYADPAGSADGSKSSRQAEMARDSSALQSVYCALEMRERLKEYNARRASLQKRTIEIGIGLTHGEIISGPIGSKERMDFTVIGDVVNLASRIEKLSKEGKHTKILFSNHVEERVRGLLQYERMDHEPIRGKSDSTEVYELIQVRDLASLLDNLRSQDHVLRRRSLELLGQSRNSEAIPSIITFLDDSDEEVRLQAVIALGKLAPSNDDIVLDALFKRLRDESSIRVVAAMVTTLGRLCTDERILEIADLLQSPHERIVANAVEALGQARIPKATDLLLPMLSSRNNRVKANAAMALFAAGHIEVIDTLKPMMMHSDPMMRSSAAFAIGELTLLAQRETLLESWKAKRNGIKMFMGELQECVPMLVSLLKDPDSSVKRQAVIALGKIKDKSSVLPLIDNIDLEKDSKDIIKDIAQALRSIGSHQLVREVLSRFTT